MIIFKDIVSKDEVMSDSYDMIEVDKVAYEVDCSMITLGAVQVDTGANASAEEAEEGVEDGATTINNVVNSFRLQATSFDKKSYLSHLKGYMKKIKEHIKTKGGTEEDVANFEKNAQAFAKKIVASFKDYEFYVGESMDPDGMVLLLNYREDGTTPFFTIWKDGLIQEKV